MIKREVRTFFFAIGLSLFSLTAGILGYMLIEDYDLLEAFYMTVITISTVGFSEVNELSSNGRLFTAIYIMTNLAIFGYVISALTSYFFEGKLKQIFHNYMSEREINKLKDHIIVCGYGRNGSQACAELIKEKREFVVIESDPKCYEAVDKELKLRFIPGNATQDQFLLFAGIERANELIIATPGDADNVFITLTARQLNPSIHIIARASEEETESKLYLAGANHVIMPYHLGGMFMAQLVTKPAVIEFLDFLTGRNRDQKKFILESIAYNDLKAKFKDKTIKEIGVREKTDATVVAVKDDEMGMLPNPSEDTYIGKNDTMILLCRQDKVEKVLSVLTDKK